ncbi:Sigma-54-dependent Fis family transcriptional regulator [Planctomycetales bacterium 10988]|nr:Sigma-54-dependent Fis family transcriptional regulator [Planctomycetales bacterium 10988]
MLAYLVIREGAKWTDVYRLISHQTVSIGRSATNQIVLKDDRCSRYHAEIFRSEGNWMVRDLDSRNGTIVNRIPLAEPHALAPGDVIKIGRWHLAFVHDLSKAFPDSSSLIVKEFRGDSMEDDPLVETQPLLPEETITINTRLAESLFDTSPEPGQSYSPEQLEAFASLYQLGGRLARTETAKELSAQVLDLVLSRAKVQSGGILLCPPEFNAGDPSSEDLELLVERAGENQTLHPVPQFLANTTLRDYKALMAEVPVHQSEERPEGNRHSSVSTKFLCAPIRPGEITRGVLFCYALPGETLEEDALHLALSASRLLSAHLHQVGQIQLLNETLSLTQDENRRLRERLGVESEVSGKSLAITRVTEQIQIAAEKSSPVLIRGENGVGKETVARAIHFASNRKQGPLVRASCAVLNEEEFETVILGSPDTSADGSRKKGLLEMGQGGTFVLGEIGELSLDWQAKLMRFLDGHPFERLSGNGPGVKADVRLITSTRRNLEDDVHQGRFRQDLYLRLQDTQILIPALRRRPEDVPVLANHFLEHFCQAIGRRFERFTPAAMERLMEYPWPGNIRELKNVVERAVLLSRGNTIDLEQIALSISPSPTAS